MMQTVDFLSKTYIVRDGIGLPEDAINLKDLTDDKLLTLHNLLAMNMERQHGGRIVKIKSRLALEETTKVKLVLWEDFEFDD